MFNSAILMLGNTDPLERSLEPEDLTRLKTDAVGEVASAVPTCMQITIGSLPQVARAGQKKK